MEIAEAIALGDCLSLLSNLVEAGAAVNRPILPRAEGNDCRSATFRADDLKHLAVGSAGSLLATRRTTIRATLRFVQETFQGVKLLLASREDELRTTFATR